MLHALRTLGEILGGPMLHDPIQAAHVVALEFDEHGRYLNRVHLEPFSAKHVPLYLYKKAKGSNPPTLTPTLILNRNAIEKSLKNARSAYRKLRELAASLPELDLEDKNQWPLMAQDIAQAIEGFRKRDRVLLTIRIGGRWMGEREDFRRALLAKFRQEGQDSLVIGRCAVCGEEKEVSGDISPFKFYTIDKPGYVVGGFDKAKAYKAFPLCYDCRDLIQRGRQHVEANLSFDFVGSSLRYWLIPDFIFGKGAVRQKVLELLTEERGQRQQRLHTLSRREFQRITTDEEDILELLSEERDVMTFHFLFMAPKKGSSSQERIELYIQDVYPSRLKSLFEAKQVVNRTLQYTRLDGTWQDYDFTYAILQPFFPRAVFYEIVDSTFRSVPLAQSQIIPYLIREIRRSVRAPFRWDKKRQQFQHHSTIQDALATLTFIQLTTQKEVSMSAQTPSTLDDYLDSLPALDSDLKKGLVLLGALTEHLLRVQYCARHPRQCSENAQHSKQETQDAENRENNDNKVSYRSSTPPFWKALKGLRMNEIDIRGLLPKVRNKLEEYGALGQRGSLLFQKTSTLLVHVPTPWKMSVDEMNFYFALGMGLFPQIERFIPRKSDSSEEVTS